MFLDERAAGKVACGVKLIAAAAMLVLAGCETPGTVSDDGAPRKGGMARSIPRKTVYLPEALDSIYYNSSLWRTLSAKCRVEILAPGYENADVGDGPGKNVIVFDDGDLFLFKRRAAVGGREGTVVMNLLHVRVGKDLLMVSDGRNYYVEMARLWQEFSGEAREVPRQGLTPDRKIRVPLLPQDIADVLEPAGPLWEYAPVLKQDQDALELLLMEWIPGSEAATRAENPGRIRVAQNLVMSRESFQPSALIINGSDDAPRALVRYIEFTEVDPAGGDAGASAKRCRVPSKFWIGYPGASASVQITLTDVKIDQELNPMLFKLEEVTR